MSHQSSVESIFVEAIDLPAADREEFLQQRCGQDAALRSAVEELIRADEQAGQGEFLGSKLIGGPAPPVEPGESRHAESADDESDRFRIMGAHREGGLGEVLIAHDRQLDRDVAVKQIKSRWKGSQEAQQRFVQEAKVTGRLEHPGIVPVYAMGTWPDGGRYYAMRFIHGETMKDAIESYHRDPGREGGKQDRSMQLRELLARFIDVCQTIQYAHSKHVLHRDIKPSNIMVGPYGETLVVDWGLAKLLDEPAEDSMTADFAKELAAGSGSTPTQVGGKIGTPQYMSPEQARGSLDGISIRTDVYLLGATLYHILTGRPPHSGTSITQLLQRAAEGRFDRPRSRRADVPPPLESICLKAMAADPADRYVDADCIADEVNRWLADQPVSAHRDSIVVRANRWMRRHRTAASSIAVAALLIALGGVAGSIFWNVTNVRQLRAEDQRRAKERELEIKQRQRLVELTSAASTAEQLAMKELARNRFSSAQDVLVNAIPTIAAEEQLQDRAERISEQADRIAALVDFYQLSDVCEQQNILSRDTKALMACTTALKRLGVWDRPDWWNALPRQDLSAQQFDTLCWDVYQQMMLMEAMLIKSMAVRLGGFGTMIRTTRRMGTTSFGKTEAEAALILGDRLDRFRTSESSRLYRSFAEFRLSVGPWIEGGTRMIPKMWIKGSELGLPRNSADAHSFAVLSMIAAIDPKFRVVFHDYHSDDSLTAARDLFERAASLRPTFYGAHLGLGQVEYLIAKRDEDLRWEDLAASLRAFGQCITLQPDRCFAYADRSSIYRAQARLLLEDERYDPDQRRRRAQERLQWSLADAERAIRFYREHPWVGWQAGQSYAEVGQVDRAIDLWIQTGIDSFAMGRIADTEFIAVDDLRGRAEIGEWLESQLNLPDPSWSRARGFVALAGVRLNQNRSNEALAAADSALAIDANDEDARAFRAMALLREGARRSAELEFEAVFQSGGEHPLAAFGMALCNELRGDNDAALGLYQTAEQAVLSSGNQAAAALGVFRTAALTGDSDAARDAIRRAIELEPASDLLREVRPAAAVLLRWKESGDVPQARIDTLEDLIRSVSQLPRPTRVETMPAADSTRPSSASLLNGGFELGSMKYWIADSGAHWETESGVATSADVDSDGPHSGDWALRVDVNSETDFCGRTGQSFSILAGVPYELSCWVKADKLSDGDCRIESQSGQAVLSLDDGTYPWRRVTGTLLVRDDASGQRLPDGKVVETRIRLLASGTGTLWIDDLSCQTRGGKSPDAKDR